MSLAELIDAAIDEMRDMLYERGSVDQLANYVGNRTLGQVVAFGVGEFQPRNRLPADDALRHRLQYAYIIEFASRWVISHPTPNVELLWQESFVTDRRGIATTIPITNKEEQAYLQNEGWVVLPPQQPGAYFPNINILAGRLSLFYLPGMENVLGATMLAWLVAHNQDRNVIIVAPNVLRDMLPAGWQRRALTNLQHARAENVIVGMYVYWAE